MTAKAALAKAFLDGKTLNVKNCFDMIGLTNCPRESSRMIEQGFGVTLQRIHRNSKSRYGRPVSWVDYRLLQTTENSEGIQKMKEYVAAQKKVTNPKTTQELKQMNLL